MGELAVEQRAALTALIDQCPDAVLSRLAAEAARLPSKRGRAISELLTEAGVGRRRRDRAFEPILPLFAPRADGVEGLTFPLGVLARLWRQAADREPEIIEVLDLEDGWEIVGDRICLAAAAAVRDRPEQIWPVDLTPLWRDMGLDELAGCLDLTPMMRRATATLDVWLRRPDAEQATAFRLLMRDAGRISPDGPRRVIDILFAHLPDSGMVVRLLNQASGASGWSGVLESSEMAIFVDRLIDQLQSRTALIESFRPDDGAERAKRLSADVAWCADLLNELDMSLSFSVDGVWGVRLNGLRRRLAEKIESLLRLADVAVQRALPMSAVRLSGRMMRRAPQLSWPAGGPDMETARVLVRLIEDLRGSTATLGCEAARLALASDLVEGLSDYADEALIAVNAGEADDELNAVALVEQAADLLMLLDAVEMARSVRRRATVAGAGGAGRELGAAS